MKVVWISHSADLHGAECSLLEGVRALTAAGVETGAVLPRHGALAGALREAGAAVSFVPHAAWMFDRRWSAQQRRQGLRLLRQSVFTGVPALVKHLTCHRPDVVVSNTATIPIGAFAARLAQIPHVWFLQELCAEEHFLRFYLGERWSLRLIDRLSQKIMVASAAGKARFERAILDQKLQVVYCAAEVPQTVPDTPRAEGPLRLALLGYLSEAKRQEDAVRAVSILAGKGLEVHLKLVGGEHEEYGSRLRSMTRQLGIEHQVAFEGWQPEPWSCIAACDAALNCSHNECLGRVTAEAMKLGKPVLGANSGGTAELIRDGWNGFLYRPADPEDLACKIESLCRNRPLAAEMGRNARQWSEQTFSRERYAAGLVAVFHEVLHRRPAGRRGVGVARRPPFRWR